MEQKKKDFHNLKYLHGYGNIHESEALEGALPKDQNLPQKSKYGLLPELISGSTFTTERAQNRYS